jgi:hypothetical protein
MKLFTKWRTFAAALVLGGALLYGTQPAPVVASDHDDGETQIKARNLSLTDLYVFREDWQTGDAADAGNLVMIMNTNPRSLPRQQYFFNTEAVYSFNIGRQSDPDNAVSGRTDLRLDFRFAAPDANGQQAFSMDVVSVANELPVSQITVTGGDTTPAAPLIGNPNPTPVVNNFTVNGQTVSVFAGLREDPFFFDVQAFFKVRAALAGAGPLAGFAPTMDTSQDFAKDYNVNAIVVRAPIALLQSQGGAETTFDVWETISLPVDLAARQ